MNSLEWRVKKLEERILGQKGFNLDKESILNQLINVTKSYNKFLEVSGESYLRYKNLPKHDLVDTSQGSAELVLMYEDELNKYMQDLKQMAEKSENVLKVEKWPNLVGLEDKLNNLIKSTQSQWNQVEDQDQELWEVIKLYKKNLDTLKDLEKGWNERLEAYEGEDRKDKDEEI